ncbi:MAG TPA: alpha/beta fold hydrolase, partial [Pseudonocardiaceae bacterium]|nr:alpha/beta fold hydrolase [Pseudonocardiaceae bacterium]
SPGQRCPLVIVCSGFTGMSKIHPERFARWLTRRGYLCFSFDYRGYGESEGPRFRVILDEQVRDIRNAVAVAAASKLADAKNVFLLGWAMGGGLVLDAARELDGVRGICAVNGLYDGPGFQYAHRGEGGLAAFRRRIREERFRRATTGIAEYVDPFDIYPLDEVTRRYVTDSLEPVEGYEATLCSFELAESMLRWSVLPTAPDLRLPLFLVHGDSNKLHPAAQAAELGAKYGGPVEVLSLEGAGHTEWMHDDDPLFARLCDRLHGWLQKQIFAS